MKPIKHGTISTTVGHLEDEGRPHLAQLIQDLWDNWQEKERMLARLKVQWKTEGMMSAADIVRDMVEVNRNRVADGIENAADEYRRQAEGERNDD